MVTSKKLNKQRIAKTAASRQEGDSCQLMTPIKLFTVKSCAQKLD